MFSYSRDRHTGTSSTSPSFDPLNMQMQPVARNGRYGTVGQPTELMVNCFNSEIDIRTVEINHYDLSYIKLEENGRRGGRVGRSRGRGRGRSARGGNVSDDKPPPLDICTKLVRDIEEHYSARLNNAKLAHDGKKNVYTSVDPGFSTANFTAQRDGIEYDVRFRLVRKISMQQLMAYLNLKTRDLPQDAVACLDIVLRTIPLRTMVYTGKAFAIAPEGNASKELRLGDGCEAWCCFYQAFKPHDTGLYLSFDISYTVFYTQQTIYDFAVDLFGAPGINAMSDVKPFRNGLTPSQISRLNNELRGLRIEATYQPPGPQRKPKMIKCITSRPASQLEFEGHSRRMSIAEYFVDIGNPLELPHLPCVDVQSGKQGHTFIPLEMAMICPAQRRRKQMPLHMQGKMVQTASRNPALRAKDIGEMFEKVNAGTDKYLGAFGVKVKSAPVKVKARILPPPTLAFSGTDIDLSKKSNSEISWSVKDLSFAHINGELDPWGVLNIADIQQYDVLKFVRAMIYVAESAGMKVTMPKIKMGHQPLVGRELIDLCDNINSDEVNKGKHCRMIMVIKNDTSRRDYNQIKNVGDTYLGMPTQCVVAAHATDPKELYCRNVLLKMNAKLGGVNWRIKKDSFWALTGSPYLIIGISVSHAPATEAREGTPSIAAAVGSMDPFCGTQAGVYRLQSATAECIEEAGSMVGDLVVHFHERWGFLPKSIIVYRDGCSDGQFPIIMSTEIADIKAVCAERARGLCVANYQPKLSFIVLQKRHHTRFFPADPAKGDNSGNCGPGTVIDTSVAHSVNYDFYLIAHNGIQGTSRPVRYTMLRDDHSLGPDEIQCLTYHLCFTFCRATTSVSIVPAVYYADLLAIRCRAYLSARNTSKRLRNIRIQEPDIMLPARITEGTPIIHKDLQRILFYV